MYIFSSKIVCTTHAPVFSPSLPSLAAESRLFQLGREKELPPWSAAAAILTWVIHVEMCDKTQAKVRHSASGSGFLPPQWHQEATEAAPASRAHPWVSSGHCFPKEGYFFFLSFFKSKLDFTTHLCLWPFKIENVLRDKPHPQGKTLERGRILGEGRGRSLCQAGWNLKECHFPKYILGSISPLKKGGKVPADLWADSFGCSLIVFFFFSCRGKGTQRGEPRRKSQ